MFFYYPAFMITICSVVSAFTSRSPPPSQQRPLFDKGDSNIRFKEFSQEYPTYTIMSSLSFKILDLLEELEKNKMNYVWIDRDLFSPEDYYKILRTYGVLSTEFAAKEHVFLEDKKYIGGIFELYEEIFRWSFIHK